MSNNFKLVIIVLSFFLALTFVRGFSVEAPNQTVVFNGSTPVAFPITITNASNASEHYSIQTYGPFTYDVFGGDDSLTVPTKSYKTITLFLSPKPPIVTGTDYHSLIRVIGDNDSRDLYITLSLAPGATIPVDQTPTNTNTGTGLATLPSATELVVNGILIIIIGVLSVALVARVKNRVMG